MRKFSKKSVLLCGVVLAVCAFAAPMASGASWFGGNVPTHVLASNDLAFTAFIPALGGTLGSQCADSEFHGDFVSAAVFEITGSRFSNCTGQLAAAGCTTTASGTNFPWTATARTTSDIQIHGVDVDVLFEGAGCLLNGQQTRITGTLTGGQFVPSATPASRRINFVHDDGLTSHGAATGSNAAFVTGSFRDTNTSASGFNIFD